ncbi:MAG TPA: hypothetical protein VHR84_03225 [Terriglobales bacterium]|jgi:hypothetical protein|nr:hypothetical protein [Terriglobales bacterium]
MKRRLSCCLLVLVGLVACSKKSSRPNETAIPVARSFHDLRELPGTIADFSLTSNTVRIDEKTTRRILKSLGSDGNIFVFDDSDPRIQNLQEGQVLFLENIAVQKVLAVVRKDKLIIVGTDYASLPDFIQQGHLKWDAPIQFASVFAKASEPQPAVYPELVAWWIPSSTVHAAGTQLSYSGNVDGWDTTIGVAPGANRLEINFKVSRSYEGMSVMVNSKGFVKDFVSSADVHVSPGNLDSFSYEAKNLNGEMNVEYAATRGDGDAAGIDKPNIKLPPLAKIPMPIAGIPFMLTINANLILKPGFGAKKEAASGSFRFTYSGDEGFQVKAGNGQSSGSISGSGSFGHITTASLAPHAILIGMAAPKITLSLGPGSAVDVLREAFPSQMADTMADFLAKTAAGKWAKKQIDPSFKTDASASVQTVAVGTMTAAGSLSMVPCKLTRLLLEFKGGADTYLLGMKGFDKEVVFAKKEFVTREPDINACGDK